MDSRIIDRVVTFVIGIVCVRECLTARDINSECHLKRVLKLPRWQRCVNMSTMTRLEELVIFGLSQVEIPQEITKLETLRTVKLYIGQITTLHSGPLRVLSTTNVTTLSFRHSNIKKIDVDTFSNLPNLRNLNLACNYEISLAVAIKVIGQTVNTSIDSIILDYVNNDTLFNILNFADMRNTEIGRRLRRLSVRQNSIFGLHQSMRACLPALEILNLAYNAIITVQPLPPSRLVYCDIFPSKLWSLDISHGNGARHTFEKEYCDVEDISFDDAFRTSPYANISSGITAPPAIPDIYTNLTFHWPPSLRYLYANSMRLSTYALQNWTDIMYSTPINLVYLNLSNTAIYAEVHVSFPRAPHLLTADLSLGGLTFLSSQSFLYWPNIRHLNLSENKLGMSDSDLANVFQPLFQLEQLSLSKNGLRTIGSLAFSNLMKLASLDLSHNLLTCELNIDISQLASLRMLDLSYNSMSFLKEEFRSQLDILSTRNAEFVLSLRGNPFVCICEALPFLQWLRITNVSISAPLALRCVNLKSILLWRVSLTELADRCRRGNTMSLVAWIVLSATAVSIMFALATAHYCRWRLYWLNYRCKRCFMLRWRYDVDAASSNRDVGVCDAYVAYADADADWVMQELRARVEDIWGMTLFIYDRDTLGGRPIWWNIVDGIDNSRRTLVVLTPAFLADRWCNFALQMTLSRHGLEGLWIIYHLGVSYSGMPRVVRSLILSHQSEQFFEEGDTAHARRLFWLKLRDQLCDTCSEIRPLFEACL